MTPTRIVELVSAPLGLSSNVTCEAWGGGDVNQVFRVNDGEREFAVKWTGNDHFSGIDKTAVFALQKQVAQADLAPEPVWLSNDHSLWVEAWQQNQHASFELPGVTSGADDQSISTKQILLLASALASIHQQNVIAPELDLPLRWQHYIKLAALPDDHEWVKRVTEFTENGLARFGADDKPVLCHNDLSLPHIVETTTPVIVDWEYAAMGNRYFDLASCGQINQLGQAQKLALYQAYALYSGLEQQLVIEQCLQQEVVVALTASLWYAALPE